MKNGRCPMCDSNEIYTNTDATFRAHAYTVLVCDDTEEEELDFSFVPYVCMNCGFTSMYVGDMNDIKDLPKTKGWKKVP